MNRLLFRLAPLALALGSATTAPAFAEKLNEDGVDILLAAPA